MKAVLTTYFIVVLFGLAFGSFLNVCIYRLSSEQRESIVTPGSHCRQCGQPIRWYDNIPVLSYALLRGRCRRCGAHISFVYPLVEALTAGIFLIAWVAYGPTLQLVKAAVFSMLLLVVVFTDLLERIVPRRITVFGIGSGLLFSFLVPVDDPLSHWVLNRLGLDTVSGKVETLSGEILHYTCDSLTEHRRRIEFYTDLAAREMLAQGARLSVAQRLVTPPWVFLQTYFLRLGVFDGRPGFWIAWMAAHYVHRKYAKVVSGRL